jgi:hypothetical protein
MFIVLQNEDIELARFDTSEEAQEYIRNTIKDYQESDVFLNEDDFSITEEE